MRAIGDWFGLAGADGEHTVLVVGCPVEAAVSGRAGAAEAPAAIRCWARTEEAVDELGEPVRGVRVLDAGDLQGGPAARAEAAAELLREHADALLLGLGGDHSITPSLARAVAERHGELGFVLLDAHPDLFPDYDGDRHSHACALARVWDEAGVQPRRSALVGLRSYARVELVGLREAGVVIPAAAWREHGPRWVAHRVAEAVAGLPVYLSVDIDVLDPSAAPGTGYPVTGGPDARSLMALLAELWRRVTVVAVDLVEVAPALDPAGITAAAAAHLLLQVLAYHARSRPL